MRQEFVQCKHLRTAKKQCPWASKIVRVVGGFRCFESWDDYYTWQKQI